LLQLEPEHSEGLYNLGELASEEDKPEEARLLLRRVVVAHAGDAHAQINAQVALAPGSDAAGRQGTSPPGHGGGLATCSLKRDNPTQPYGELANKAKELRGGIAGRDLRVDDQPEGLRQDAVGYCLQVLQLFEGMDQQLFMAVFSEVAAKSQRGLQINAPDNSCSLKTLPGSWSDLALAWLIRLGV
jgi:hypothetical protein